MSDMNLFFKGFFANIIKFGGIICLFIGLIALTMDTGIGMFFIIGGIVLLIWGSAKRFEYKRQSGSIIHKGDW